MDLHMPTLWWSLLGIALFVGLMYLVHRWHGSDDRKERRRLLKLLEDYSDHDSHARQEFARAQLVDENFLCASWVLPHAEFMWFNYAQKTAKAEVRARQQSVQAA